jgi:hypothetical protein
MDKLELLFADLKAEYAMMLEGVAKKMEELEKKIQAKDAQKVELDKREKELSEKELGFVKKSADIEEKYAKIMSEEQLRAKIEEYNTLVGQNEELFKKSLDHEAEARVMLEQNSAKELALSIREATYEEQIRKKFADKLLK